MAHKPLEKSGIGGEIKGLPTELFILVLFNDDVNSFDHVLTSLMEVCEHTAEQAEQCTFIAHLKGVANIKSGPKSRLQEMCIELIKRGIRVEVRPS